MRAGLGWLRGTALTLCLFAWQATARAGSSPDTCTPCHPKEVAGYSKSAMAHSLRRPDRDPEGAFVHSASSTRFVIHSDRHGLWQRMERDGDASDYHVDYVIGSGAHAYGYLVRIGAHLFQSPICFYTGLGRYDMAPGAEHAGEPDFVRPISMECLLCHSGKPLHIAGTLNEFESPAFAEESISCDRCHGDPRAHLKKPLPGSIINPAKLPPAARDSVCEQCHIKGAARVLNPGKQFEDFHPGEPLEQVFTVYRTASPAGSESAAIKVISQSEQLALSVCSRESKGRLWCGTCHDPHASAKQSPAYYRARCLTCHAGRLAKTHPEGNTGNCIGCHMVKQNTWDGGHTALTDHRISRRPPSQSEVPPESGELIAWREAPAGLAERNLGLAYMQAGFETQSASQLARGYQILSTVEKAFPDDPAVLNAMAQALLGGGRALEAARRFDRVLAKGPDSAATEADAGRAWMAAGDTSQALRHLERAAQLDPLNLPAAEALMRIYQSQGDQDKAADLSDRVRQALGPSAPEPMDSTGR